MTLQVTDYTVGVEEEFHLVDADTGRLRADVAAVQRQVPDDANVEPELLRTQVETGTPVCRTLTEVRSELLRTRRDIVAGAARAGCRIAAGGTWPGAAPRIEAMEKPRYEAIVDDFGPTAREATVCGCHVHVAIPDREVAVAVVRRSRPWLPVLLAISANSPFWRGNDSGYASYRSQVWARWPTAGPPPALQVVRQLLHHLGPGLSGDTGEVHALTERVLHIGTGASRQRTAFAARGRIADVVELMSGALEDSG